MKIKFSRAAVFVVSVLLVILTPQTAYAAEDGVIKANLLLRLDSYVTLAISLAVATVFLLVILVIMALRIRKLNNNSCAEVSCDKHPLHFQVPENEQEVCPDCTEPDKHKHKHILLHGEKPAHAQQEKHHHLYPERLLHREMPRASFGVSDFPDNLVGGAEDNYFSQIETPRELTDIPSLSDTARFAALRSRAAAAAAAAAAANQGSYPSPQRLTANYGLSYQARPVNNNFEHMDLTLGMIQKVVQQLEQRDALLQADLLQHTGATGQFSTVGTGKFAAVGTGQFNQVGTGQFGQVGANQFNTVVTGQFPAVAMGQYPNAPASQYAPMPAMDLQQPYNAAQMNNRYGQSYTNNLGDLPPIKEVYAMRHSRNAATANSTRATNLRKIS